MHCQQKVPKHSPEQKIWISCFLMLATNLEKSLNSNLVVILSSNLIKTHSLKQDSRLSYFAECNYSKRNVCILNSSIGTSAFFETILYTAIPPIFVSFSCKVFSAHGNKVKGFFPLRNEKPNIFKCHWCQLILFHVWECKKYFFPPYSLETVRCVNVLGCLMYM